MVMRDHAFVLRHRPLPRRLRDAFAGIDQPSLAARADAGGRFARCPRKESFREVVDVGSARSSWLIQAMLFASPRSANPPNGDLS
jgi:hypothetical protein